MTYPPRAWKVLGPRLYSLRSRPVAPHTLLLFSSSIYIYNRRGRCLYYKEWKRTNDPMKDSPGEDQKLMFGLIFSLQQFVRKISPIECVLFEPYLNRRAAVARHTR